MLNLFPSCFHYEGLKVILTQKKQGRTHFQAAHSPSVVVQRVIALHVVSGPLQKGASFHIESSGLDGVCGIRVTDIVLRLVPGVYCSGVGS